MRARARWPLALLASAWVANPGTALAEKKKPGLFDFQPWKTPVQHERDAARHLAPGSLDLTPAVAASGDAREVRVRVYADREYRTTVIRWQAKTRAQIARINRVVVPVFNVRFEIEGFRDWERRGGAGATLETALAELAELDEGADTDWVIGFVTPFRGVATSMHQIGMAPLLGRHFVLRGMDDEQEGLALDRELGLLPADERQGLYGDRKAHKEIVSFLHEWAHTMGALHHEDRGIIMNPSYDPREAAFSAFEKQLLVFVIERRLAERGELRPERNGIVPLLESAPPDEGTEKDRAALIALARGDAARSAGGGAARLELPKADATAFNEAVAALNAGREDEAWTHLLPLLRKHPRKAPVMALACPLVGGAAHGAEARAACDSALALAPTDSGWPLDAALSYLRAHDEARAVPLVLTAIARATALPPNPETTVRLARVALQVGALSAADTLLAGPGHRESPEAQKTAGEIETARRRFALPRDAARWGVPSDREPAYKQAFWEAVDVLGKSAVPAARARARAFATSFPEAPGTDLLACEVEVRAGHAAAAAKRCEAALAKFDEAVRPHFLLGLLAARGGREAPAEKHLRRAIALDPEDPAAWRELAHLYRATGARQRLADLRGQHQALLRAPLEE